MTEHVHGASLLARPLDRYRLTAVTVAALTPALGVVVFQQPTGLVSGLLTALVVALVWSLLFGYVRANTPGWDWIVTAVTFAVLVPDTVPMWQQVLALSFGVVMGEQIFGGRGRNFLHPTVVALAFLMFSFPGDFQGGAGPALAIATAAGALLLLFTRIVSWRVIVGIAVGLVASLVVVSMTGDGSQFLTVTLSGTVAFGAAFLIADPVAAASTRAGRWAYGLLAGMLVVVFGQAGGDPGSLRAMTFAALLASLFAPMIDQSVIWLNVRRRQRRG